MNILQTEWWSIGIPPEWWTEQLDDVAVIADSDDVGAIEISTLRKDDGEFDPLEVSAIAKDNAEQACDWQSLSAGDFAGVCSAYMEGDVAVREWYLARGAMLLFITYNCELENRGMDDAAVDDILSTLAVNADG